MTDRERLKELIGDCKWWGGIEEMVDYLIANGVIVPPYKVGDTVYLPFEGEIEPILIAHVLIDARVGEVINSYEAHSKVVATCFADHHIGKTVFLTKEEAEQALKERDQSGC